MGKIKKRAGFTLIEVVVAMAILMVVILALVSSYYSYYRNVQLERYKTIGENLMQLQLEDIQNLPVSIVDSLIIGGADLPNYPSKPSNEPGVGSVYYFDYSSDPAPDPSLYFDYGTTDYINVYDSIRFDTNGTYYELVDGTYIIEKLAYFDSNPLSESNVSGINASLPSNIKLIPPGEDGNTSSSDYMIELYAETFPHYKKRIIIIDLTPDLTADAQKIFKVYVIVYWKTNGVLKSITLTGLKNAS